MLAFIGVVLLICVIGFVIYWLSTNNIEFNDPIKSTLKQGQSFASIYWMMS